MMNFKKLTFVLSFVVLLILTGCGNKVKCEKSSDNIDTRVLLKYDGNKEVTEIEYKLTFNDDDIAKTIYEYYSNIDTVKDLKIDGSVVTYSSDADTFKDELYATDKKIDTYKLILEGQGYTCR